MRKHLFPLHLEPIARAMGDPDDTYVVWPPNRPEQCDDVWVDWEDLSMQLGTSTVIYTSLKMSEEMVQYVSKIGKALTNIRIVGVIEHGAKKFAPFVLQGAMRFVKEEGAEVQVVLPREHEDKLTYYTEALSFQRFGLTPIIVDAHVLTDDEKMSRYKEPDPKEAEVALIGFKDGDEANVPTRIEERKAPPSFFVERRGGGLFERDVRGTFIGEWEGSPPHSEINAHYAGLPVFMNPSDLLVLGNLVEFTRPALIVEMNAYKYGITALLLQLSTPYGTRIIAQNQPFMSELDEPWRTVLERRPGAERLSLVYNHPEEPRQPYDVDGEGGVLFIVNYHQIKQLIGCARLFFDTVRTKGMIAFHAPNHLEAPKFIQDFRKKPGVSELELRFNPPGGSWYKGGIFQLDQGAKGDQIQSRQMPEEM